MNIKKKTDQLIQSKSTIAVFFILFILSGILFADRNFLSFASVQNLVKKGASDGGFLALGMTFVILIGQIDLSVGSVLALGGVLMAMFGNDNMLLGIGLGLLAGAACGFLNGFMVAKMKISSWIATLAMMLAVRGMIMLMTSKKTHSHHQSGHIPAGGLKALWNPYPDYRIGCPYPGLYVRQQKDKAWDGALCGGRQRGGVQDDGA